MATILETKTQPIISLNGAYYILISKKARDHHSKELEQPLDHKTHQAVVETILEDVRTFTRISFESKPAPAEAQPVQVEPRSAVEAIEQAQAAALPPQAAAPGIPVETQVDLKPKKEGQ